MRRLPQYLPGAARVLHGLWVHVPRRMWDVLLTGRRRRGYSRRSNSASERARASRGGNPKARWKAAEKALTLE